MASYRQDPHAQLATATPDKAGLQYGLKQCLLSPALALTWINLLSVLQDLDGQKE